MSEQSNYTGSNIKVLEGLDAVRKRPGMYIGDTGEEGLHHMIWEVVDNSVDEALAGYGKEIILTLHKDNSFSVQDFGRGIPVDIHPTEGIPAVTVVLTVLHAGGKFDSESYKTSGGLHGVGASVVNALSEKLSVDICRGGKLYHQEFERGVPTTELEEVKNCRKTGTKIWFKPDPTIFKETLEFQEEKIIERIKSIVYLNKGLKVTFINEKTNEKKEFLSENGLVDFINELTPIEKQIIQPVEITGEEEGVVLDFAFVYEKGFTKNIISYTNNVITPEGGTHEIGTINALTRSFIEKMKEKKVKDFNKITTEDVKEGLTAIISIRISEPEFRGQTKGKLNNPEARSATYKIVKNYMEKWIEENPKTFKELVKKFQTARKAREAAKKSRELIQKESSQSIGTLPGKLADCQTKDRSKAELFLVEGDSAGGCFTGDTKVSLADGRELSFLELIEEDKQGKQNFCYTVKDDGTIGIEKIINPRKTKKQASLVEVTLDNNEVIRCTPDHKFLLVDGSYVEAQNLTKDMNLMPLYRKYSKMELALKNYNHKIKSVRKLDYVEDVYDIEIPNTHNFALSSGVFVHNSGKQGRDRVFQAILPLKGKILNVSKANQSRVLSNDEIKAFITALGVGFGKEYDYSKLRYNKIIIMADADVDGGHIQFLNLLFLNKYYPELIEKGHVYVAVPPLYRAKKNNGKESFYLKDEKARKKRFPTPESENGWTISRFKGLGEMDPEQLWETTMNPETRTIIQVQYDNSLSISANDIFDLLGGDNVSFRKWFLMKYASKSNLDI